MNLRRIRINPITAALILVGLAVLIFVVRSLTSGHDAGTPTAAPTAAVSSSPTGVAAATPTPVGQSTTPASPAGPPADADNDEPAPATPAASTLLTAAQDQAEQFTARWLNTTNKTPGQWRADLTDLVTPELADQLADADPGTVPVGQIGAPVVAVQTGSGLAQVKVPITTGGTLTLTVTLGTHPLISDIDWATS